MLTFCFRVYQRVFGSSRALTTRHQTLHVYQPVLFLLCCQDNVRLSLYVSVENAKAERKRQESTCMATCWEEM